MSEAFTAFNDILARAVAPGAPRTTLQDMAAVFTEHARDLPHPAALLDAGMVYLAMNRPYARLLNRPASALVGKEYLEASGRRREHLSLLQALLDGKRREDLPEDPSEARPEGEGPASRRIITPLRDADARAVGLVLEYAPLGPGQSGQSAAGGKGAAHD